MRFLLHSNPRSIVSTSRSTKIASKQVTEVSSSSVNHVPSPTVHNNGPQAKAWGQKCSPNCGCIIRFETMIDHSSQTILSSTVHTKSLVKDSNNEPLLTSKNRPVLQNCDCETLNTLGNMAAAYLPNKKLDDIRNMTEFEGVRSSFAFRHAVLKRIEGHEGPQQKTLKRFSSSKFMYQNSKDFVSREMCYDVMEDAFFAMVRGHMPSPRETKKVLASHELRNGTYHASFNAVYPENIEQSSVADFSNLPPSFTFDDFGFANLLSSDWKKQNAFSFYEEFFRSTTKDSKKDFGNTLSSHDTNMTESDEWLQYLDSQEENNDEFA